MIYPRQVSVTNTTDQFDVISVYFDRGNKQGRAILLTPTGELIKYDTIHGKHVPGQNVPLAYKDTKIEEFDRYQLDESANSQKAWRGVVRAVAFTLLIFFIGYFYMISAAAIADKRIYKYHTEQEQKYELPPNINDSKEDFHDRQNID